jgi:hypothetical protein
MEIQTGSAKTFLPLAGERLLLQTNSQLDPGGSAGFVAKEAQKAQNDTSSA